MWEFVAIKCRYWLHTECSYGKCKERLHETNPLYGRSAPNWEIEEELRENFDDWKKVFESKGVRANFGKTNLMVSRNEKEMLDSKINPCSGCETRVTLIRCYAQHAVSRPTKDARI